MVSTEEGEGNVKIVATAVITCSGIAIAHIAVVTSEEFKTIIGPNSHQKIPKCMQKLSLGTKKCRGKYNNLDTVYAFAPNSKITQMLITPPRVTYRFGCLSHDTTTNTVQRDGLI